MSKPKPSDNSKLSLTPPQDPSTSAAPALRIETDKSKTPPTHQQDPSISAGRPLRTEPRTSAIQVQDVTKTFYGRTVLDKIRLDVFEGETLCILGGSGSGKSTLLRLMIGNVKPDGGDIIGLGKGLANMSTRELNEYRKSIGVLFQSGALYNSMSIGENVALPLREHTDLADETIAIIVKIKLEQVGLRESAHLMPSEISGGMKKRAGLARALALDPKILFYDEPSAGLDPVTSHEIDILISDINRKLGVTSVVVTHEMDSAFRIADRMVLLDRGKFIVSGTPREMEESTDPLVKQFVHGLIEGPLTDRRKADGYEQDLLNDEPEWRALGGSVRKVAET